MKRIFNYIWKYKMLVVIPTISMFISIIIDMYNPYMQKIVIDRVIRNAVKNADEILFLDNGEIVERGTHAELLQRHGKYYEIYCDQFKEFDDLESEVV